MTKEQIKNEVLQNNYLIKRYFSPDNFILNAQIVKLAEENERLQAECGSTGHEFDELGHCIWCGYIEEFNEWINIFTNEMVK